MTFSLSIPTVDRKTVNYRHVFFQRLVETGTLEHSLLVGAHFAHQRLPNANAMQALLAAARDEPEFVLHFEDDLDVIDDLLGSVNRFLLAHAVPAVRFYPLGCNHHKAMGGSVWQYPLKAFYGATAFAMRPADVRNFCAIMAACPPSWHQNDCIDVNMVKWHRLVEPSQDYVLTPVPCFVDHLGIQSSISDDRKHFTGRYQAFGGRDFQWH